jgi:hypothetical protein
MTGRSTLRSSIIFSMIDSKGEKWFSSISPQMSDNKYFCKASVQDEKFAYLSDKLVLVEMTCLLEKKGITPRLGGSTGMIFGRSFQFINGQGWAITFQSGKWPEIFDG